jgi:hypothetical protein
MKKHVIFVVFANYKWAAVQTAICMMDRSFCGQRFTESFLCHSPMKIDILSIDSRLLIGFAIVWLYEGKFFIHEVPRTSLHPEAIGNKAACLSLSRLSGGRIEGVRPKASYRMNMNF